MKKLITLVLTIGSSLCTYSNGVVIVDASKDSYFKLVTSDVNVEISNQVATVVSKQSYLNNTGKDTTVKYAFPLNENASAINLRWNIDNYWYTASFSSSPQDTSLPASNNNGTSQKLLNHLGKTPLFFNIDQEIKADSLLTVELTYVELLPYSFNKVEFKFPNDHSSIQSSLLVQLQHFELKLKSLRTIDNIYLLSHGNSSITNNGNEAQIELFIPNQPADKDYLMEYELNSNQLGLFGFSTFLPDSVNKCDSLGNGFFAFIVEPDASSNTTVIEKDFALIIDGSGSMGGNKMQQAKDAASFIINNLNFGDRFNIIYFSGNVASFSNDLVDFNAASQANALNYIGNMHAAGSTNISGAFSVAIPNFGSSDPNAAKIVIFFTDGQATAGITSTDGIASHVSNLVNSYAPDLNLFTFGIGLGANKQLLSRLATQNDGLSAFLDDKDLNQTISNFYLTIQNPVLLNTSMTFDPPILLESFPNTLPNLYKGQQLIIVGRYQNAGPVTITLNGTAFGNPVTYQYGLVLSDSTVEENQFLPKIWAKKKMENLLRKYYTLSPDSSEAQKIKEKITELSICYNVISPFTSFSSFPNSGTTTAIEEEEDNILFSDSRIKVYPNPFNEVITIELKFLQSKNSNVVIEIFDIYGRLIAVIKEDLDNFNNTIVWDGKINEKEVIKQGTYFLKINIDGEEIHRKIIKI